MREGHVWKIFFFFHKLVHFFYKSCHEWTTHIKEHKGLGKKKCTAHYIILKINQLSQMLHRLYTGCIFFFKIQIKLTVKSNQAANDWRHAERFSQSRKLGSRVRAGSNTLSLKNVYFSTVLTNKVYFKFESSYGSENVINNISVL